MKGLVHSVFNSLQSRLMQVRLSSSKWMKENMSPHIIKRNSDLIYLVCALLKI